MPGTHNWLVHRLHDEALARALKEYASGVLVDIGCGTKPYAELTRGLVDRHWGVDHPRTLHGQAGIDLFASANALALRDQCADTVLCTAVLEHLERPLEALDEIFRILRPGGHLVLTAPLFWHVHEEPRDFYRYTAYGLEYLVCQAGLQMKEVVPLSGFLVTFGQELCYYLQRPGRPRVAKWLVSMLQQVIQIGAYRLSTRDRSYGFTWMYLLVAEKPQEAAGTAANPA